MGTSSIPFKLILIIIFHSTLGNVANIVSLLQGTFIEKIQSFVETILTSTFLISNQTFLDTLFSLYLQLSTAGFIISIITFNALSAKFMPMTLWVRLRHIIGLVSCCLMYVGIISSNLLMSCVANVLSGVSNCYVSIMVLYLPEFGTKGQSTNLILYSNSSTTVMTILFLLLSQNLIGGEENEWTRIYLGVIVTSLTYLFFAWRMPENPKQLYLMKHDVKGAKKSIEFYHGAQINPAIFFDEYDEEKKVNELIIKLSIKEVVSRVYFRKIICIVMCIVIINALGVSAIVGNFFQIYMTKFNNSAIDASYIITATKLLSMSVSFFAPTLFNKVGLRQATMTILFFANLSWVLIILADTVKNNFEGFDTFSFILFTASLVSDQFAIGFGKPKVIFILLNELCSEETKDSIGIIIIAASTILVELPTFVLLPLLDVIGTGYYIFMFIIIAASTAIFRKMVPYNGKNKIDINDGYDQL